MVDQAAGDRGPLSIVSGRDGVVVLHGFTGSPASMRNLALVFGDAGFSVELPLLPGHGTTPEDLLDKTFADWLAEAEAAYRRLAGACEAVVVVGLSLGGTLALALALEHREIAGVIVINPFLERPVPSFLEMLQRAQEQGVAYLPSIGSDIAEDSGRSSGGYDQTPLRALLSLFDGAGQVAARLSEISAPILLLSSRVDHVVPPASGDLLEAEAGGPLERVYLEHSYHVATLDHDALELEARAVEFARKVTST